MRMTYLRKQILTLLRPPRTKDEIIEYGLPPYTAARVAERLGSDVNNISKTMRQMEAAGVLTSETVGKEVYAHLMQRDMCVTKQLKGYWVTEHIEEDKQELKRLEVEREKDREAAIDKFFEVFRR